VSNQPVSLGANRRVRKLCLLACDDDCQVLSPRFCNRFAVLQIKFISRSCAKGLRSHARPATSSLVRLHHQGTAHNVWVWEWVVAFEVRQRVGLPYRLGNQVDWPRQRTQTPSAFLTASPRTTMTQGVLNADTLFSAPIGRRGKGSLELLLWCSSTKRVGLVSLPRPSRGWPREMCC